MDPYNWVFFFEIAKDLKINKINKVSGLIVVGTFSVLGLNSQTTNTFPVNGDVGIGTISPDEDLVIEGGANDSRIKMHVAGGGYTTGLKMYGGGVDIWDLYYKDLTNSLAIGEDSVDYLTIKSGGKVGIGTTDPTEKLHVTGYTLFDAGNGSSIKINGYFGIKTTGNSHWLHLNRHSDDHVSMGHNSLSNVYMVNGGGKVGIGTISPDAKLTVNGNIHAKEVKVDLSVPGPDYVFKENYPLKPLQEVQNYIVKHGHLPNIPSAQEMETQGIDLGTMNMKLLEKIEELTLYIIELERRVDNLEKKW